MSQAQNIGRGNLMDDDEAKVARIHEIGMSLEALSIDELEDRIGALKDEIGRLERAIEAKSASRSAADAVFRF